MQQANDTLTASDEDTNLAHVVIAASDKAGIKDAEGDPVLAVVVAGQLGCEVTAVETFRMRQILASMNNVSLRAANTVSLTELHEMAQDTTNTIYR